MLFKCARTGNQVLLALASSLKARHRSRLCLLVESGQLLLICLQLLLLDLRTHRRTEFIRAGLEGLAEAILGEWVLAA